MHVSVSHFQKYLHSTVSIRISHCDYVRKCDYVKSLYFSLVKLEPTVYSSAYNLFGNDIGSSIVIVIIRVLVSDIKFKIPESWLAKRSDKIVSQFFNPVSSVSPS